MQFIGIRVASVIISDASRFIKVITSVKKSLIVYVAQSCMDDVGYCRSARIAI